MNSALTKLRNAEHQLGRFIKSDVRAEPMLGAPKLPRICGVVIIWLLAALPLLAQNFSFTNLLTQGEAVEKRGDIPGAFKIYSQAEPLATNCADLCVLTKRYCDLMHDARSPELEKTLAAKALAAAFRAVQANPTNATARLCVAVSYVKNFPFVDNETKIKFSKDMKAQCETAIALDPRQDVGYYLLGRWHFGTANMNFLLKGLVRVIYGAMPQASNEEAIKNFKQAIELAPNRIIHHRELAKAYEAVGETKLAASELEKCRRLKPLDRDDEEAQRYAGK